MGRLLQVADLEAMAPWVLKVGHGRPCGEVTAAAAEILHEGTAKVTGFAVDRTHLERGMGEAQEKAAVDGPDKAQTGNGQVIRKADPLQANPGSGQCA